MGCGASCWVNLCVRSMDILYSMHTYVCVFFYSWSSLDVHKSCSSLLFSSRYFSIGIYILFGMCIYVSVWEHLFFERRKNLRLRILCDLYSDYLDSLVMMLPVQFEWCCEKNRNTNSNNQFHIQIRNSKYWTLIKSEANANIYGRYSPISASLFLFDYFDSSRSSHGYDIYTLDL